MKKVPADSAVRRVADEIRRDALDRPEGELLGSELELLERYSVSRPTLRQAIALAVQENLLRVRRGVGGGYFIARPDSKAVAHVAAVFLRSRKTTQAEIVRAIEPIRIELAKLAASCLDGELIEAMRNFVEVENSIEPDNVRFKDFIRQEREFGRLVGEMSGNHVLSLFMEILYDFVGMTERNEDYYRNRPDRVETYRSRRNQLATAIVEGDQELVALAAKRCRIIPLYGDAKTGEPQNDTAKELLEFLHGDGQTIALPSGSDVADPDPLPRAASS